MGTEQWRNEEDGIFLWVGAGRGRVKGGGLKGGVAPWKNKACQRRGDNTNSKSYGGIVALKM